MKYHVLSLHRWQCIRKGVLSVHSGLHTLDYTHWTAALGQGEVLPFHECNVTDHIELNFLYDEMVNPKPQLGLVWNVFSPRNYIGYV